MALQKRSMTLLFSVVLMDMIGFGFIIPILPDYLSSFGGSQSLFGILLASYALGQFIAAPIVGRLSDRFGRKPLLLLSIGGTFISLLVLGFARTLPLLFVSRIVDGLTGGNVTVAQSYIADITDEKDRSKGLGIIGAAFGLGFIMGPLFGGVLVGFGMQVPAFVAAGIAATNLLLIAFVLPESLPKERRNANPGRIYRKFSLRLLREALTREQAGYFLHITFIYSLAFTLFESMFSPHAMTTLGLDARSRSFLLAYVGVLIALVQGGGIGLLVKRFPEKTLLRSANLVLVISMLLWAFSRTTNMLIIALAPLSVSAGIMSVMNRSLLSKSVTREEIGGTLGLSTSLESMNRIIAPLVGGFLLSGVGPWAPGVLGAILLGWTFVFIIIHLKERATGRQCPFPGIAPSFGAAAAAAGESSSQYDH